MNTGLTSNITKGGALIEDTVQFILSWDSSLSRTENLKRVTEENILGLPTLSRAASVAHYALGPRFVDTDHEVLNVLRALLNNRRSFIDACYFEATRADELLGRFAEEAITNWYKDGQSKVNTESVESWINDLAVEGNIPMWSDSLRRRAAQGLIATLRDFGRLDGVPGSRHKKIARPNISGGGFAYAAYRLHQLGLPSRGILRSTVWHRWLLDHSRVEALLHQLVNCRVLYYSVVGSTMRIDWQVDSLEEAVRAAL